MNLWVTPTNQSTYATFYRGKTRFIYLFIYLENLFVLERFDSRSEGKEYFCDTYSPSAVL